MENLHSNISEACYINIGNDRPGIVGLFMKDQQHGLILSQLADYLLQGDHELPIEFRELIAAYVSKTNNCNFCYNSHKAFALAATESSQQLIEEILCYDDFKNLSPKYYYLLQLAKEVAIKVQVGPDIIKVCKEFEATDEEILRTVQIASAFCMYNRYVDGLGTVPGTPEYYKEAAQAIKENGYVAKNVMG